MAGSSADNFQIWDECSRIYLLFTCIELIIWTARMHTIVQIIEI